MFKCFKDSVRSLNALIFRLSHLTSRRQEEERLRSENRLGSNLRAQSRHRSTLPFIAPSHFHPRARVFLLHRVGQSLGSLATYFALYPLFFASAEHATILGAPFCKTSRPNALSMAFFARIAMHKFNRCLASLGPLADLAKQPRSRVEGLHVIILASRHSSFPFYSPYSV